MSATMFPQAQVDSQATRRVVFYGGAGALALLAIGSWFFHFDSARTDLGELLQFAAALLIMAPILLQAVRSTVAADADCFSDQLLAIAMLGALAAGEYITAVVVPLIMAVGHLIEQHSIRGTQAAISGLLKLQARQATIETPSGEQVVPCHDLTAGQIVIVRPGEILPADGVILSGTSSLDESSITGESVPRDAETGGMVFAGSMNLAGRLRVEVTRVGVQTSLGKIAQLLQLAWQSKAPVQKTLERYAGFYVPGVALLAAFVFLVTHDVPRMVTVFIVSCPCAMVLAGPAATVAAIAVASRCGILVKNARFLDALADADTVVFDKTGTLTTGQLELIHAVPAEGVPEDELLASAALCAQGSQHPIARAIRTAADLRGLLTAHDVEGHREVAGCGVECDRAARRVRLGRAAWLEKNGVICPPVPQHCGPLTGVACDDRFLGFLLFADPLRGESRELVDDLRILGIDRVVLLTGDRYEAAAPIAESIGCNALHANMLPEQKLVAVRSECQAGRKVLVVGDGINDALALAAGNVSIALGARGSEIAIQSSDIALMSNDLRRVADAIRLSRISRRVILQNLFIALMSTLSMLALSAVGAIDSILGAVLHNVGTIGVLLNSARLLQPALLHPHDQPGCVRKEALFTPT